MMRYFFIVNRMAFTNIKAAIKAAKETGAAIKRYLRVRIDLIDSATGTDYNGGGGIIDSGFNQLRLVAA